jgi:uncharacterized protein YdhG (YjbR/CyaY superfamily)
MVQSRAQSTDEYLLELPPDRRATFARLRSLARSELDGFHEGMRWGMMYFQRDAAHGVGLASQKQHIAIYLGPELLEAAASKLHGQDVGKGCLRFPSDAHVDWDLLKELLRAAGAARTPHPPSPRVGPRR